ncbi:hypothetical protein LSAT2_006528 [Lamellibrachia satsuma]|nr:hypothetical protein LSAT2_006528 [Lamellibrachia satsuma]
MDNNLNIVECLQNTSKGRLHYDRKWCKETLRTLEECTSPPNLPFMSPVKQEQISPNERNLNRSNATWGVF